MPALSCPCAVPLLLPFATCPHALAPLSPFLLGHAKGVYGSLADLLEVPPQLSTAVEVVCGNQAFQVRFSSDGVLHLHTMCAVLAFVLHCVA